MHGSLDQYFGWANVAVFNQIARFFEYERHSRLEMPMDQVDKSAVGKWIDDRLVSCVKAYLALQENLRSRVEQQRARDGRAAPGPRATTSACRSRKLVSSAGKSKPPASLASLHAERPLAAIFLRHFG